MDASTASAKAIHAYTLVNGIPRLTPVPGYTTSSLGLLQSSLPSFKVATRRSISPSNAQNELPTSSLSSEALDDDEPDASEDFIEANDVCAHHLETPVKATRYQPNAATQMISRYRPSAIPAGFDWGSDASDISDEPDDSDSDASDESDDFDSDNTDELTAGDANVPDGIEEYEGRCYRFTYTLTDRDLMISYGYKDGVSPFLHYDEYDNLVVEAAPVSSGFDQLDDEESDEESEEAALAGKTADAQDASCAPNTSAMAPLRISPLAMATPAIAPPAVRPATTKVATSKRKVAAKPRQKAQKDVLRAARTWVSKSNKTEMRKLLAEWFGEGYTDAENANDLGARLSALQKAHIESPDNKEKDNASNEVLDEELEAGEEAETNEEVVVVKTLQSSLKVSGKSRNALNSTTAKDGNKTFEEEFHQTGEEVSVNSIGANQDTDMAEANYDVSAGPSASLIGKKRQRGDIEDPDDNLSEVSMAKKAKMVDRYENVKQLGRPIKKAKKWTQV